MTFEQDGRDLVGKLDAKLNGGALIKNGRLMLDGEDSFAETGPTLETLKAKTLEAWVALSTLDQRGGGVVTTESIGGGVFDALVFGERQKSKWMAGSNNSVRTQNVNGPAETAKPGELIHLAVVYQPDGRIELYRNGQPYGTGYAPANEKADSRIRSCPSQDRACSLADVTPVAATPSSKVSLKKPACMASRLPPPRSPTPSSAGTLRGELTPIATKR